MNSDDRTETAGSSNTAPDMLPDNPDSSPQRPRRWDPDRTRTMGGLIFIAVGVAVAVFTVTVLGDRDSEFPW